jgi:hypothetical protein
LPLIPSLRWPSPTSPLCGLRLRGTSRATSNAGLSLRDGSPGG